MPYIKEQDRKDLTDLVRRPSSPGELNFIITKAINDYLQFKDLNYSILNEVIGSLECAKQEFYRRVLIPYENKKIAENGDVYTQILKKVGLK